jgi:hypothetical protein
MVVAPVMAEDGTTPHQALGRRLLLGRADYAVDGGSRQPSRAYGETALRQDSSQRFAETNPGFPSRALLASPVAEIERIEELQREERQPQNQAQQLKTRGAILVLLRSRIHGGEVDSARWWLHRQRRERQRTPREVFEELAAYPEA